MPCRCTCGNQKIRSILESGEVDMLLLVVMGPVMSDKEDQWMANRVGRRKV